MHTMRTRAFLASTLTAALIVITLNTSPATFAAPRRAAAATATGVVGILPDTSDGIHLAQIASACGFNADPTRVDFVWNWYPQDQCEPYQGEEPPGFFYVPFDRQLEGYGLTTSEIETIHPDWIVYTCPDGVVPQMGDTTKFAWEFGDDGHDAQHSALLPLDTTNHTVLSYIDTNYVNFGLANNWSGISFDNVTLYNDWKRCGVWRPSTLPNVYQWHYLYGSGPCVPTCTAFKNDASAWEQHMFTHIHGSTSPNPSAIMTINWSIPFPQDANGNTDPGDCQQSGSPCQQDLLDYESLLPYTDLVFDEMGFSNYGHASCTDRNPPCNYEMDNYWDAEALAILFAQGYHNINSGNNPPALLYNCYEPQIYAYVTTDERQWCVGNYLLFKGNYSYDDIVPQITSGGVFYTSEFSDYPEFHVAIGQPLWPLTSQTIGIPNYNGVYLRQFAQGEVLVNPSSSNSYTVPMDWTTYKPIYCDAPIPSTSTTTLSPHSALMLITQQTACVNETV